jgi:hypothetical protein
MGSTCQPLPGESTRHEDRGVRANRTLAVAGSEPLASMPFAVLDLLATDTRDLDPGVVGEATGGATMFLTKANQLLQVWRPRELRVISVL